MALAALLCCPKAVLHSGVSNPAFQAVPPIRRGCGGRGAVHSRAFLQNALYACAELWFIKQMCGEAPHAGATWQADGGFQGKGYRLVISRQACGGLNVAALGLV